MAKGMLISSSIAYQLLLSTFETDDSAADSFSATTNAAFVVAGR